MSMEHLMRIAFGIVTLFACFHASPTPVSLSEARLSWLKDKVKCPENSMFYAPTNVTEECLATALDCVRKELDKTVRAECEGPNIYIDNPLEYIEDRINEHGSAQRNSSQCNCQIWPQTSFSEFVEKIEYLLQLNAMSRH